MNPQKTENDFSVVSPAKEPRKGHDLPLSAANSPNSVSAVPFPKTASEWANLALQILEGNLRCAVHPARAASVCRDASRFMIEEAEAANDPPEEGKPSPIAASRRAAADLLALCALMCLGADTLQETERGCTLAQEACQIPVSDGGKPSLLALVSLAASACALGLRCKDAGVQLSCFKKTIETVRDALDMIATDKYLGVEAHDLHEVLLRLGWIYVMAGGVLGHIMPSLAPLQKGTPDLRFLLLLAAVHSQEDGDEDMLRSLVAELSQTHPNHVVVLLFSALLHRHRGRPRMADGSDFASVQLIAAVAAIEKQSNALFSSSGDDKGDTLRSRKDGAASTSPSDGAGGPLTTPAVISSRCYQLGLPRETMELTWRRTVNYWVLAAHVANRIGCYTVALTIVEAGLTLLTAAPCTFLTAYSDLLVTRVEALLCQYVEQYSEALRGTSSRPMQILQAVLAAPLGMQMPLVNLGSSEWMVDALELNMDSPAPTHTAAENEGVRLNMKVGESSQDIQEGLSELRQLPQYLIKAIDVDPSNSQACYYFGFLQMIEGLYSDVPAEQRMLCFEEAAHYFSEASLRRSLDPSSIYATGCVHMVMDDSAGALDYFSSALELGLRTPLIPFERLWFMMMN